MRSSCVPVGGNIGCVKDLFVRDNNWVVKSIPLLNHSFIFFNNYYHFLVQSITNCITFGS